MTAVLTAPLPPAAVAAMVRLERALTAPAGDQSAAMSAADRAAHASASYVRHAQYGVVA